MITLHGHEYRRIRQAAGLSRQQAADRCRITLAVLREIEAGRTSPTPAQHARLVRVAERSAPARSSAHADGLTPRQAEMIALTWRGLSNAAIAQHLGVSEHTVKNTLSAAYERLGVARSSNPRAAAAVLVWEAARALSGQREAA